MLAEIVGSRVNVLPFSENMYIFFPFQFPSKNGGQLATKTPGAESAEMLHREIQSVPGFTGGSRECLGPWSH